MGTQKKVRRSVRLLAVLACCVPSFTVLLADGPSVNKWKPIKPQKQLVKLTSATTVSAPSSPARASYQVLVSSGQYNDSGSGTAVHPRLVVTNSHVVDDRLNVRATVANSLTGVSSGGIVVAIDKAADLAVIMTDRELDWVQAKPDGADDSKPLVRFGFGGARPMQKVICEVTGRNSYVNPRDPVRVLTVSQPAIGGDSGCGVFQDGKLVATLWGSAGYDSKCTETVYLTRLFARNGQLRQAFQTVFGCTTQGCFPSATNQNPATYQPGARTYATPQDLGAYKAPIDVGPVQSQQVQAEKPPTWEIPYRQTEIDMDKLADMVAARMPKPERGPQGLPGRNGTNGTNAAPVDYQKIVDLVKSSLEIPRGVTMAQVDAAIQQGIQAALDTMAKNQPRLPDPSELARQIQPYLDPIGVDFVTPSGAIAKTRDGEPMRYEQRLGGRFVFKYSPGSMSVSAGE